MAAGKEVLFGQHILRMQGRDNLIARSAGFTGLNLDDHVLLIPPVVHPLETDPNTLHRLASAGSEVFHEVYRLVQ